MAELEKRGGPAAVTLVKIIHAWILPLVDEIPWGKIQGRFVPTIYVDGMRVQLFVIRADGKVAIRFMYFRNKPPFNNREAMLELLRRVNEIPRLN